MNARPACVDLHQVGADVANLETPWGRVHAALLAVVDADSEDDSAYDGAIERFRAVAWDWLDPGGELRALARTARFAARRRLERRRRRRARA